jgi:hypothetical protein
MQAPNDPIPHVIIRTAESDHGLSEVDPENETVG